MGKQLHVLKPRYRKDDLLKAMESCIDKGWTGDGDETVRLEDDWRKYTGYQYCSYVNSCTAALHLALLALKERYPGRRQIIVPDITFVSSASVVLQSGLELVLCPVDQSLCLDTKVLEGLMSSSTLCVIYVGIGGNTRNLLEVEELVSRNNIKLVIDAAHMGGSRRQEIEDTHLGTSAEFICYSFQAVKNLGIADSGMLCSRDESYASSISRFRWMGINKTTFERTVGKSPGYKWEYDVDRLGFKYNGNALIAACCRAILQSLDGDNEHRRKVRARYNALLANSGIKFIVHENNELTSGHLAQVLLPEGIDSSRRNEVIARLNEHGVFPGVHYKPVSAFTYYREFASYAEEMMRLSSRTISLPCHLDVNMDDCEFIIEKLIESIGDV